MWHGRRIPRHAFIVNSVRFSVTFITGVATERRYECDLVKHEGQCFAAAALIAKEGSRDPEQASEGDSVSILLTFPPYRDGLGRSRFLAVFALVRGQEGAHVTAPVRRRPSTSAAHSLNTSVILGQAAPMVRQHLDDAA